MCGDARNAEEAGIRGCRENGRGSVKPMRIDGKETEEHLRLKEPGRKQIWRKLRLH